MLFRLLCDRVNVLVFEGEKVVTPSGLRPSKVRFQYKAEDNKLHEEERDNAKYWTKGNIRIALLGLENQTDTDQDMPFRIIGYDGAAYRSQLLDKHSKERFPVLSLVLYFGNTHWTGPKTIHEMVSVPKGLEKFVNDYKIHIFEISYLTEEQVNLFSSDFQIVADYFVQRRKNKSYIPSNKTIRHVDAVLKLMSAMTGDQRFNTVRKNARKRGMHKMCEILDEIENRGIMKGIKTMKAENNVLRAERDAALAEKNNALAEKNNALAEKEAAIARAEQLEKLLRQHNIAPVL